MTDDDTPQSCSEWGQTHQSPEIQEVISATLTAFFTAIRNQGLDDRQSFAAAVLISSGMGDAVFNGTATDKPLKNRSAEEKLQYLLTYVDRIDDHLAVMMELPTNLSADDDEEINPAEIMPGLNRVH